MADDEVIRRKLLIDCDGMGDDRRITMLLKTFTKWCMTNDTEEESLQTYERMLAQLAQCEFSMIKAQLVSAMNKSEMENYETLSRQIADQIKNADKNIEARKNELVQAKLVRKNKQQYDGLAKVIQKHPDRQVTLRNLNELHKELENLNQTKNKLDENLEIRRKHFQSLLCSIHELQMLVDEEEIEDSKQKEMEVDPN